MNRAQAVAAYGHHFIFKNCETICEELGSTPLHPEIEEYFATEAEAVAVLRERLKFKASARQQAIRQYFNDSVDSRFYARAGLHIRGQEIREKEQRLSAESRQLREKIEQDFRNDIRVERLPEQLRLPHILAVGATVYKMDSACLADPPETITITSRRFERTPSYDEDTHAYKVHYEALHEKGHNVYFQHNSSCATEVKDLSRGTHIYLLDPQDVAQRRHQNAVELARHYSQIAASLAPTARARHRTPPQDTPRDTPRDTPPGLG